MSVAVSSYSGIALTKFHQQSSPMAKGSRSKTTLGQRIARARQHADMTQTSLGRAVGITRSGVSQWEGGQTEPTPENLRIIAMQTGANYEWLATGRGTEEPDFDRTGIPVKGYVGAGAQAHFLPLQEGELDRTEPIRDATPQTVAFEIRGDSLGELFDRWLVFFDDVRRPVTPDLVGKLCVVGLADGRTLVKKIRRATNGLFDLLSNTQDPIRNVEIEWAARVKIMSPR